VAKTAQVTSFSYDYKGSLGLVETPFGSPKSHASHEPVAMSDAVCVLLKIRP
jgi:hypothetical protein